MGRYMMYIAYIGREFRGLQRQTVLPAGCHTIVGALEEALSYLKPSNEFRVYTSSRTDSGVNAVCNTVHVDLHPEAGESAFRPDDITATVNQNMMLNRQEVRVLQTLRVSDDFNCRFSAKSRTYVYRSAICRQHNQGFTLPYTPFEYQTACFVHKQPINMDLLHHAAEHLSGTHDFSAFSKHKVLRDQPWVNPVKTLTVAVTEGQPFLQRHLPSFCNDNIQHLEFVFNAKSFIYRQVRKMTAVMLGVGTGRLELDVIKHMLEDPSGNHVKKTDIYNVPAWGLYLTNVEYDKHDLLYTPGCDSETPGGGSGPDNSAPDSDTDNATSS